MKKLLILLGTLGLSMIASAIPVQAETVIDTNSVSIADVLMSKKVTLGLTNTTDKILSKYDTNSDGTINIIDTINLKRSFLNHFNSKVNLDNASLVDGYDDLYTLTSIDTKSSYGYANINLVGDNLLISVNNTEFSLYDVSLGKITNTVTKDDKFFGVCYPTDDGIIFWNSSKSTIDLYDSNLDFVNTYDVSKDFKEEDGVGITYCGGKSNIIIHSNNTIKRIILNDDGTYSCNELDIPYYSVSILETVDNTVVLQGFSAKTLLKELAIWNLDTNSLEYSSALGLQSCNSSVDKAVLTSDYSNYWSVRTINGESYFYQYDNNFNVMLTNNGNIATVGCNYQSANRGNSDINIYTKDGINKATLSYSGDSYSYLDYYIINIPDTNYYYLLSYDYSGNYNVLLWDTSKAKTSSDLQQIENPSKKSTEGSLDEFKDLYSEAKEIGDKYGVNIYIADTTPTAMDEYSMEVDLDTTEVSEALTTLNGILSIYPENFFTQLLYDEYSQMNFYLCGNITGSGNNTVSEAAAFVFTHNDSIDVVLNTPLYYGWNSILNHELSHAIDSKLDFRSKFVEGALYSEDTWSTYNPSDFSYMYSYNDYEGKDYNEEYFLDAYSTTYPTEDRAELFGYSMGCYYTDYYDKSILSLDTPMGKKFKYYCDCIRDGFDTSNWDDVMPWEQIFIDTAK